MRVNKALSLVKAIGKTGFDALGWAVLGAAVGATAAGLCGVLCGTLTALIYGDLRGLTSVGLYFALCGAVAGTLVGGFARMIDPEGIADLTSRSPQGTGQKVAVFLRPTFLANSLMARWRLPEGSSGSPRIKEPSLNENHVVDVSGREREAVPVRSR